MPATSIKTLFENINGRKKYIVNKDISFELITGWFNTSSKPTNIWAVANEAVYKRVQNKFENKFR